MAKRIVQSGVSETSICNQALSWLKANRISSLDETSREAELCRENYPFLRDAVLESRPWTFATAREVSTSQEVDGWGFKFRHEIPLDWIWVWTVYRNVDNYGQGVHDTSWRREGRSIISDHSTIYLKGTLRVIDTGAFSFMFTQALAARVAADLAIPLTGNPKLQTDMWQLYMLKLEEAATRDGQQGANDYIVQHRLTSARFGGLTRPSG